MYINGSNAFSNTITYTFSNAANISLGTYYGATTYYTGFIGGVRIVNGTALYTTNFTPPTSAFTFVAGTSLLMNMFSSATALTDSANNTGFTFANSAAWSAFSPMGQSTTLATLGAVGNIQQTSYGPAANTGVLTRRLDINGTTEYFALYASSNMLIQSTTGLYMYGNPVYLYAQSGGNMVFNTSNAAWNFSNTSNSTQVFSISGLGNLSNSNATSNNIGGSTLSNSILTVGAATAGSTTTGSVNVAGGYFVNGVALTGGSAISTYSNAGAVLFATGTSTGLQGSSNLFFSNSSNLGIQTTTPATALDVNGGVTIRNGYRPTYSNVSSGTSFTVPSTAYGTHFNITASSITGITLPTVVGSTDSNAYWVFRNNTAGYLSITFTYTTAGTTYPTNPVTIPPANSLTMMVTFPSSVLGYVLF